MEIVVNDNFSRVVKHIKEPKCENNEKILVDLSGNVVRIYYISMLKRNKGGQGYHKIIIKTAKISLIK